MQHFLVWTPGTVLCVTLRQVSQHVLEWVDIDTKYSMSFALGIDALEKINIVLVGHEKRERGSHLPGKSVTHYCTVT